ncbi:hypothetical protein Droror1_Dr00019253 [Drosera rotundifolia]
MVKFTSPIKSRRRRTTTTNTNSSSYSATTASTSKSQSLSSNPNPYPSPRSSYVAIAPLPLPVFSGSKGECPIQHLSRFAKVCRANNGESEVMMERLFPVTLRGEAEVWYDLNVEPYRETMGWGEVREAFVEAYGDGNNADERFRVELMTIHQGLDEGVRSYSLRLQWLLKRWPNHDISEALLRDIFIDGLRPDFKEWIIPQKPCSLKDALRLAFTWETVMDVEDFRNRLQMKDAKCGFCDGPHDEDKCEIRGRMRELWMQNTNTLTGNDSKDHGNGMAASASGLKKQKSLCRCSKHQCWKKLDTSNSSRGLFARIPSVD